MNLVACRTSYRGRYTLQMSHVLSHVSSRDKQCDKWVDELLQIHRGKRIFSGRVA